MRLKQGSILERSITAFLYPEIALWLVRQGPVRAQDAFYRTVQLEAEELLAKVPERQSAHFVFNGKRFPYIDHPYNLTRINERCVEIPIFLDEIKKCKDGMLLELGNVLKHYSRTTHQVIDKYERGQETLNVDILNFDEPRRFDLALSISTLEHIGWDYKPRKSILCLLAIGRLLNSLNPSGRLVASVPMGYNRVLDLLIRRQSLRGCKYRFMRRITAGNDWEQCDGKNANQPYVHFARPYTMNWRHGPPYPFANAICILEMNRDSLASVEELLANRRWGYHP